MRFHPLVRDLVDRFVEELLAAFRHATLDELLVLRDVQRQARRAATATRPRPAPPASAKEITNPEALLQVVARSASDKTSIPRRPRRTRARGDSESTQPKLLEPLAEEPPPPVARLREGETLLRSGRAGVVLRRRKPVEPSEPGPSDPPPASGETT